ncbi:MAG: hypothetical protein QMD86_01545 [Patescibacteria group bacterium]|nr:hypothetical protein [Patescibacteria group bacterium]
MNRIKIAAVFLIIGAGVIGAYLIAQNPAVGNKSISDNPDTKSSLANINPIKWVESLVAPDYNLKNVNEKSKIKSDNLTNLVASSMFNKMKEADQSGNNPFGSVDYLNDSGAQQLLEEYLNFDQYFSGLDKKYLKISNNNSKESKIAYLQNIERISDNRLRDSNLLIKSGSQIKSDINDDCFIKKGMSLNYQRAQLNQELFNDYSSLEVPSDWADFQKKMLVHFKIAQLVYSSLANCANDPMKASLFAEKLPDLFSSSIEINKLLTQQYEEVQKL